MTINSSIYLKTMTKKLFFLLDKNSIQEFNLNVSFQETKSL